LDILIDSSVIIASERGTLDLDEILSRHADDFVALSAVGLAELYYGAKKRPPRYRTAAETFVAQLVSQFSIIPFDSAAAEVHASLRLSLEQAGTPLGHNDLQIASIAIANDMAVAARDRDFARVERLTVIPW
jgi:predicted nucleic acid-binding protein